MLKLKRAYEPAARQDGQRFLVERLWPQGVKKSDLRLDAWLKTVAPSTGLRKWYSHDVNKWIEFQKRYRTELKSHPDECATLMQAARKGTVTLVYAAHDTEHNSAAVLCGYLEKKLANKSARRKSAA